VLSGVYPYLLNLTRSLASRGGYLDISEAGIYL
jgi:hypothetical protein